LPESKNSLGSNQERLYDAFEAASNARASDSSGRPMGPLSYED